MMLFHEAIALHAASKPNKEALVVNQRRLNYGQINEMTMAFAELLRVHGVQAHERVAVYAPTSIESITAMLGVLQSRSVLVLARHGFNHDKVVRQLNDVNTAVLVVQDDEDVDALLSQVPVRLIIRFARTRQPGWLTAVSRHLNIIEPDLPSSPEDDRARAIFFTSGSTASAKGVVITNRNMLAAYKAVSSYLDLSERAVILNCSAIHSDYGFYNIVMPLFGGGVSVTHSFFAVPVEKVLDLIVDEGVTGAHLAPSFIAHILKADTAALDRMTHASSLRYIASTTQALPVAHIHALSCALPLVTLHSMFGMTECKRIATLPPAELETRPESVGKPIPGVHALLVDEFDHVISESGQVGELVVAGDLVAQGYWRRPELNQKVFAENRFGFDRVFYTGDLFRLDDDGFFYHEGRRGHVFSRSGFTVNPRDIEEVLKQHPAVGDVKVLAVPDELEGFVPRAFIACRPGLDVSDAELKDHCRLSLDWYAIPPTIEFRTSLPLTPTGKTSSTLEDYAAGLASDGSSSAELLPV